MSIKESVNIQDSSLLNAIAPALKLMSHIEASRELVVHVDFAKSKAISPIYALALSIFCDRCNKSITFQSLPSYLESICFPFGVDPEGLRKGEFGAKLEGFSKKTYMPIVSFPANSNNDDKEYILSMVEDLIIRQTGMDRNISYGFKYLTSEAIDNISEHSESKKGYIIAQTNSRLKYLDICIADAGITLLGSYKKLPNNEILSDIEAIQAASRGIQARIFLMLKIGAMAFRHPEK